MLRTGTGVLSNVKIIIQKRENRISFPHWADEKSGNPEKVGRMASLPKYTFPPTMRPLNARQFTYVIIIQLFFQCFHYNVDNNLIVS